MKRKPFNKVLVANRGEIAVRVMRACRELGIETAAIFSDADANAIHRRYADESHHIGAAPPTQSYLQLERIVKLAADVGAEAIHPGYGFLSERPEFPEACAAAGIAYVGPPAGAMRAMGSKLEAKRLAGENGVPVTPGSEAIEDVKLAAQIARDIGFPVIVKPSGGGGGIGMTVVERDADLIAAIESCKNAAAAAFGDPTVYVEKYVHNPRHIEFQIIADDEGNVVHLGERECSIQRRHQKIMEETPSPALTAEKRAEMGEAAVRAVRAAGYINAGTVEFIFSEGQFYFLEVNARLQVEHPITEEVTGIDLVKEQLRVAAGQPLSFTQSDISWTGHAIEMRINAEDPARRFMPNPKRITRWVQPAGPGVRVDSGFGPGSEVPPNYDSLVAKLIVHGADRAEAIARGKRALREFVLVGPATTIPYHQAILESQDFLAGKLSTRFIDDHPDLLNRAKEHLGEVSPFDYGPDPRHIAAAAAAVAALTADAQGA
ncbi:MAG: acetyl-CoA carboxylase biotin carboxylase subunit [Candidatus Dormibacter sp.]|uniref:acetyl-CoA carboxylase biotin carboxylase subunit n=1 Tax=Candidatus Dormibacter sp. TaxID=2973982 RepID=UPI000DB241C8|nr:MAG: acetyl-CoA carboxylase biotin carboxylase subunit [Candidatus Dormibacteraeota bacterium]